MPVQTELMFHECSGHTVHDCVTGVRVGCDLRSQVVIPAQGRQADGLHHRFTTQDEQ